MAVNPDPKPGRWILPLVILGMVAFTYFFVRSLPEASPDTTLVSGPTTTVPADGETTTVPSKQITLAPRAAHEAVTGLRSTDPGDLRRAAVAAFTNAVTDFDVEVANARTASGAAPDA